MTAAMQDDALKALISDLGEGIVIDQELLEPDLIAKERLWQVLKTIHMIGCFKFLLLLAPLSANLKREINVLNLHLRIKHVLDEFEGFPRPRDGW